MSEDDEDIYGDDSTPIIPVAVVPDSAPGDDKDTAPALPADAGDSYGEPDKKEIPKHCFSVKKLDWWITDEQVLTQLKTVAPVVDLRMKCNGRNGKFDGTFECVLESERSKNEIADALRKLKFGDSGEEEDEDESERRRPARAAFTVTYIQRGSSGERSSKKLSCGVARAAMLYENPKNPIPHPLLAESSAKQEAEKERSKKDEEKRRKKLERQRERDRERDRDRERERERYRRRRDDYDYDYDDYDYRRRRDRDRYHRDEEKHREKRRK